VHIELYFYTLRSRPTAHTDNMHRKQQKHALNEKTADLGYGMENCVLLWAWGSRGHFRRFFCGYMG